MSHEMDLIPASYRERQKIQHWCHLFLIVFVVICLAIVMCRFSLANKAEKTRLIVSNLQKDKSFNLQQQQTYNELLATERVLQKNLEILSGLRGGPSVRHIFTVIDRVMNGSVWFDEWSFQRAGEMTEVKQKTVQRGYFIIIEQDGNNNKKQAWKLNTHMDIKGQAKDHSSLSHFVTALINQPEIEDVKVISTNLRNYTTYQVINFQIIVTVNNQFKVSNV
jgi:hypothetical protein